MISSNLGMSKMATCVAWYDQRTFQTIATLSYSDLKLEINKPRSQLIPEIQIEAQKLRALKGTKYQVSTSGQTIELGYNLP